MEDLTEAALAGTVDLLLHDPVLRGATVAALVRDLATGRDLIAHAPERRLTPASNTKLYTAAFALDTLGPRTRLQTIVEHTGRLDRDGTLQGDLILRGAGDPTLDRAALADLAGQAACHGLRRVAGRIVADMSAFPAVPFTPGWTTDGHDLPGAAPPSALSVDGNCVIVHVWPGSGVGSPCRWELDPGGLLEVTCTARTAAAGSACTIEVARDLGADRLWIAGELPFDHPPLAVRRSVVDPARRTATLFARALAAEGIAVEPAGVVVRGGVVRSAVPARRLARQASPDIAELIRRMNKPSDNFIAEHLFHLAGEAAVELAPARPRTPDLPGTAKRGESRAARALRAYLARTGVAPADDLRLEDGSGLSRYNLVSPAATVRLLEVMRRHAAWTAFAASLPVAAVDGSLAERMRGTRAAGLLTGKTGTLTGVSALAGYLGPPDEPRLAYAVMVNGFVGDPAPIRAVQDRIGAALAEWATGAGILSRSANWP